MSPKTIQPFISLGWYTVPLSGTLKRKPDGKKTEPLFEKDWKSKYRKTQNLSPSKLGGVLTGKQSNILAIDCDNDHAWNIFRALDPDYQWAFISNGKEGGTHIYSYDNTHNSTYSIRNTHLNLDIFGDKGFVYLPTEDNTTKEPFTVPSSPPAPLPPTIAALLASLKEPLKVADQTHERSLAITNCQAHSVEHYVSSGEFSKSLFSIITPKSFRQEPQYVKHGYLHPDSIKDGAGSEYLMKVSAILGADPSIDESLYVRAMHSINSEFSSPMDSDRLDSQITTPMLTSASIDGNRIWQFDEGWETDRCIIYTKRKVSVEVCFDDVAMQYYLVDFTGVMDRSNNQDPTVQIFNTFTKLYDQVAGIARQKPKRAALQASIPIVNIETNPTIEFGFIQKNDATVDTLNTFVPTPALTIMHNPSTYAQLYKPPDTILKYLSILIPDTSMRHYLLQFLRYKFTTFEYSPVTLYFLGVPGSGKDTFMSIIGKIIGPTRVAKPSVDEFLDKFNGWLNGSYFVHLSEYGDQLNRSNQDKALGKLKDLTGSRDVQMRLMHNDGIQGTHNATIISTANKNGFGLDTGDRRIALFETPNVLRDHISSISDMQAHITEEINDFAYYLSTQVRKMTNDEYNNPPWTDAKHALIANSMPPLRRIIYAIEFRQFDYLKELAELNDTQELVHNISNGKIYKHALFELYQSLYEEADERALTKAAKARGLRFRKETVDYKTQYYIDLDFIGALDDD